MTSLSELIKIRRGHLLRFANQNGAAGEATVLVDQSVYIPRPKGVLAKNLLAALSEVGQKVKLSSFDAIALPAGMTVDLADMESVRERLPSMVFIEIKTATQARVKEDFSGFFFAFTEGELLAPEVLGDRHKVLLVNKMTGGMLLTSVTEILAPSKSRNWQVSVQL